MRQVKQTLLMVACTLIFGALALLIIRNPVAGLALGIALGLLLGYIIGRLIG